MPFNGTFRFPVPWLSGQIELRRLDASEASSRLRGRAIRGRALGAAVRDPGAADIATCHDAGVDVVFCAGRGIPSPPSLPDAIRAALKETLAAGHLRRPGLA